MRCLRCGAPANSDNPQPSACEKCPPVECAHCHEPDDRYCSCWQPFASMPFADVKATFAEMDLSVGTPEARP
ncbi:hypothetical protein ACLQ3K_22025 [Tsukamurella sp. DT100]|uniref:hypothetical protein n=1 Tax=Tsukamurella sp. DT100 TaxID=3393415 RepID=UPI003CE7AA6F